MKKRLLVFLLFISNNFLFAKEDIVNNTIINGTGTINGTVINNGNPRPCWYEGLAMRTSYQQKIRRAVHKITK